MESPLSREHSPPYIPSNVSSNGYLTPITSPSNCSSPPDSCYYNSSSSCRGSNSYNSPTHSPFSIPLPMPPQQSSAFNSTFNNRVPPVYGSGGQPTTFQSSFAVDSTVYISPNEFMSQSFLLGPPPPLPPSEYNIKQEPGYHHVQTDYSNCYYGDCGVNKTTPNSSRTQDARSRYINIGKMSSGVKPHPPMTDLDAIAINNISEWLQHSVH